MSMNLENFLGPRNVKFGERKGLIVMSILKICSGTTAGFCQAHRWHLSRRELDCCSDCIALALLLPLSLQ